MKPVKLPVLLFFILIIITIVQIVYYYFKLPPSVASHFNIDGRPDKWISKNAFAAIHVALIAFVSGIFCSAGLLLRKIPPSLLNLPNKDYWLEPQRKEATYSTFTGFMFIFADMTLVFFLLVFRLVYNYNLSYSGGLGNSMFYYLILYSFAICIFCIQFFKKFYKTEENKKE